MKWHNCKTNPPKKDEKYLLYYDTYKGKKWKEAWFENGRWTMRLTYKGVVDVTNGCMWAEVEMPEVE